MKYTKTPGVISFAGGNTDPAVFPVEEFAEASGILSREWRDERNGDCRGPTYPGALHAMRNRGARFLSVPCDQDGLRTDLLPKTIAHYAKKCEAMDAAFREYFPEGGFFFWIKVPGVDSTQLFMKAIERGAAFVTGPSFYAEDGMGKEFMRTCFTFAQPQEIKEGAKRLAASIKDMQR